MVLTNLFAGQQQRCRHREQTWWTQRGKEGSGTNGERSVETYTLVGICCMTQGAQTGLCDSLEGWDGMGGGREGQAEGDICIHG